MKYNRITRRHFLQGAGAAALALPLLPSLFPKGARADATPPKSFIGIGAWNGLYRMYGADSQLMPRTTVDASGTLLSATGTAVPYAPLMLPQHTIYSAQLTDIAAANNGAISDIIDANYTPLLNKVLMLQGFDYIGLGYYHHSGHFGNWHETSGQTEGNPTMASLDVVISNYLKSALLPSDIVCYTASYPDRGQTTSFLADGTPTSDIFYNPATLWDSYFGTSNIPINLKKTLVDQVLVDYKSVRQSARLGAQDRLKLDTHIALLSQTEANVQKIAGMCQLMRPDASLTDRATILKTMNDVIVSLIACGLCNTFMGWAWALNDSDPNNWHVWSHLGFSNDTDAIADQTNYTNMVEQSRSVMNDMCLDLAQKLDAVQLLDSSLIVCLQEHSKRGHESWNIPVIAFGSAGGTFKTGQYIDYRQLPGRDDAMFTRFGFPMNQLYANILGAMGVPTSTFEALNKTRADATMPFKANSGYGVCAIHPDFTQGAGYYASWTGYDMSSWLPLLKA